MSFPQWELQVSLEPHQQIFNYVKLQFLINEFGRTLYHPDSLGAFMIVPFLVDEHKVSQNKHLLANKL